MRQQMEEEQWDLCRLLDAALHGRPAEMLPPAEKYEAILELADRHRVLPLLYDVLAPKLPEWCSSIRPAFWCCRICCRLLCCLLRETLFCFC